MNQAVTAVTQRRKRTPWWRRLIQALIALVIVLPAPYVAAAALAPAPLATATPDALTTAAGAEPAIDWPATPVAAGFAVPSLPGAVGTWGSTESHPTASLGKLITVLVVLDAFPLEGADRGPTITLDGTDVALMQEAFSENAPIFPVVPGNTVTQRDLIEYALVDSAANATSTLARWAFGSIDGYLEAAAAWLAREGLQGTVAADASGLSPATVSTAADLTSIAVRVVSDPVLLATIQLPNVRIPGIGVAPNTNRVLGVHDIDGGKTGTLVVWGRNLFVTAVREIDGVPRRVVVIIMGTISADDTDAAAIQLLESIWPNIAQRELLPAGTVVGAYETAWGSRADTVTTAPLSGTVWGAATTTVAVELEPTELDVPSGVVGSASITIGETTQSAPVEATGVVVGPDLGWRITHPAETARWLLPE